MGIVEWLIVILIVLFFANRFMPIKGVENISVQDAKAKMKDNNVQFVDVRTPGEYKANHRKPFKNIPLSDLSSKLDVLDKEREVVVICQSGMRSQRAAKVLKKRGFEKICNVRGGMGAWM